MSHTLSIQRQSTLTFGVMYSQWVVWWVIAHISCDDLQNAKAAFIFLNFFYGFNIRSVVPNLGIRAFQDN